MNFSSLALEVDALGQLNSVGYQLTGKATRARVRASAAKYVDLFLGYVMRAELANGWWERERRIRTPYADWRITEGADKAGILWARSCDRQVSAENWIARTAISIESTAWPSDVTIVERLRGWPFGAISIPRVRTHALSRYSTTHARKRLEEETGYRQLWTPEECLDASRIYPRKSVAARFCIALADLCSPQRAKPTQEMTR